MITKDHQFNVIEDIRQKLGVGTDSSGGELATNLHRAIEHLSEDLYSKDIHFILELIQNAEDNPYSSEKDPQLIFKILTKNPTNNPGAEGALLVINNEKGFQEEHVRAICRVGSTTKTKREGYIGEKGIGFKSVFLVTSEPHIISAGYQFSFKDSPDPMAGFGYIIPYWIEKIPEIVKKYLDQTCILLPFRKGKSQVVRDELCQIAPETILFLNKLKALQICEDDQVITEVYRINDFLPKVEMHTGSLTRTYFLSESVMTVPDSLNEEKREGVTSRKISIAYPINNENPPVISIFAFLPTSPNLVSGFDFLINADFILSSNREQVQEHRLWNQWLRDSIPSVFLKGFQEMLQDQELRVNAYSYIPLEDANRSPFFSPVVTTILKELRNMDIVLTHDEKWVKPEQARFATKEVRKLFEGDQLPTKLQEIKLVAPELETVLYRERLKSIGVREITEKEIIECLKDEEWLKNNGVAWFYELYQFLQNQRWATSKALSDLMIIPASDGRIYTPSEYEGIYLPTPDADKVIATYKETIEYSEILFLNHQLFDLVNPDKKLLDWASKTLLLFDLDIPMICKELAIKLFSQVYAEITHSVLLWGTKFICHHISYLEENQIEVIKNHLPLLLTTGEIIPPSDWSDENPLVFPEIFDTEKGWQNVFIDSKDRTHMQILSNLYLEGIRNDENILWENLFTALGATKAPFPNRRKWNFWFEFPKDAPLHLKEWGETHRNTSTNYTLQDWKVPDWLRKPNKYSDREIIKHADSLIYWLEQQMINFDSRYWLNDWRYATLSWFYYSHRDTSETSELKWLIDNSQWIPTTKGLRRPSEIFIPSPEIKEFFGNTIPYPRIKLSDEIAAWLNVRTNATIDEVMALLINLASHPAEMADFKLVRRLYAFIFERWKNELKKEFISQPLVLVTHPNYRWLKLDEVIWTDRTAVFGDSFGYLEPEYEGLRTFFIDNLGVKRDVDDQAYSQAWLNLITSTNNSNNPTHIEAALEKIFPAMLRIAKNDQKPSWWESFVEVVKVWTQKDCFAPCKDVFIPDDIDLQKALSKEGIEFCWRPSKESFAEYMPLYQSLGIRSLVDSVNISAKTDEALINLEEERFLTEKVKFAISTYLFNKVRETYNQLKEDGRMQLLLQTKEIFVDNLKLSFSLTGQPAIETGGVTFWDIPNSILYISNSFPDDQRTIEIPAMIARKLVNAQYSKDLEDFIGRAINSSTNVIDGILRKRNWTLPEVERKWIEDVLQTQKELDLKDKEPKVTKNERDVGDSGKLEHQNENAKNGENNIPKVDHLPPYGHHPIQEETDNKPQVKKGHRRSSRLISYVYPKDEILASNENTDVTNHRITIEKLGVNRVMNYERDQNRTPTDMETLQVHHPGFDIKSVDDNGRIRYIEVKSLSGNWDSQNPAQLTSNEYETARELGENYWIYVVERVESDRFTLYLINDPARKVDRFLFDHGWLDICEKIES